MTAIIRGVNPEGVGVSTPHILGWRVVGYRRRVVGRVVNGSGNIIILCIVQKKPIEYRKF